MHIICHYVAYFSYIILYCLYQLDLLDILNLLYHLYIFYHSASNTFFYHLSLSPNLYPGIRNEDVLLGCGEDTPELNIQVVEVVTVEHAECRLRYLFSSSLGHII
jgi:hypothetical protein